MALVNLSGTPSDSRIAAMLAAHPSDTPFLSIARAGATATTYGQVLKFLSPGGAGDLTKLGVKPGEVVAYMAPPGGSAASAMAFLSIGAQTCAAPLSQSTTEPDALSALEQFDAKHMIIFEGVAADGVAAAFKKYAATGAAHLHTATITGDSEPGMYTYTAAQTIGDQLDQLGQAALKNPTDGVVLMLRTSGTTSKPKAVPLRQGQIIDNGAVLAATIGLKSSDICYGIMPLYHIGGISASIMCSIAVGASIACDGLFNPEKMVEALMTEPKPTWYSSVPTIHNATVAYLLDNAEKYGVKNGVWDGHGMRMIRSGAAALLAPDGAALARMYGTPIFPTYSMSEQMPISQPPYGMMDQLNEKPGSVGVPVGASCAIVSAKTLQPLPFGEEGEISISGPTVLTNYLDNPDANRKNYFRLTGIGADHVSDKYFLTGDVGVLDAEGFLSLKGRAKELIKKGGEQVSPYEVEEPLAEHPFVRTAICFGVPSKAYGEEVGCALVLSPDVPKDLAERSVYTELRAWLKDKQLAPLKFPTKWKIVKDEDLPKTKTKKYIRIGLHKVLFPETDGEVCPLTKPSRSKPLVDYAALSGFRFILSAMVMFMHFGSEESWGNVSRGRQFPWHVHLFYITGGFSLAISLAPPPKKHLNYFLARLSAMYPLYLVALVISIIHLLVSCRPDTFDSDFHWSKQPDDLERGDFCEPAPYVEGWWGSFVLTVLVYLAGLQATPLWTVSWFLGFYLWFSSTFYFCIAIFAPVYSKLWRFRGKTKPLMFCMAAMLALNYALCLAYWFAFKDSEEHSDACRGYEIINGEEIEVREFGTPLGTNVTCDDLDSATDNVAGLGFYLFPPFWMPYYVCGIIAALLFDSVRPNEQHGSWKWGVVGDLCTILILVLSILQMTEGYNMRPDESHGPYALPDRDAAISMRLWTNLYPRLLAPVTTLWVYCIATGEGFFAKICRTKFLVDVLSPHSYNCFLFQQIVAQWYFAATRGKWWNWWNYRKDQHWFSPAPAPVEWWEYFYLVGLTCGVSSIMNIFEVPLTEAFNALKNKALGISFNVEDELVTDVVMKVIEDMTGLEVEPDWLLEECGLASIGIPVLAGLLQKKYAGISLSVTDLVEAETIADIAAVIETAKGLSEEHGV